MSTSVKCIDELSIVYVIMVIATGLPMDAQSILASIILCTALSVAYGVITDKKVTLSPHVPFKPSKKLAVKDELVLGMLDEVVEGGMRPCYVITDPALPDNPIVYSSEAFCSFTQYLKTEVEGERMHRFNYIRCCSYFSNPYPIDIYPL